MLKYTNLKEGEIYYCNWMGDMSESGYKYIIQKREGSSNCTHIQVNPSKGCGYGKYNGSFTGSSNIFREATAEEREHFLQCEKAGTYVEYKPEIVNYSIY